MSKSGPVIGAVAGMLLVVGGVAAAQAFQGEDTPTPQPSVVQPVVDAKPVESAPAPTTDGPSAEAPTLTARTAQEFASIRGGSRLPVTSRWGCDLPMKISIAAPQAFEASAYAALEYPVAYLQSLGYDVSIGPPTPYQPDITDLPPRRGDILVVIAPYHEDQKDLGDNSGFTYLSTGKATESALILLDGSRQGLRPDVMLHEFGHVLGLDHRAGTVMSASWVNSGHFDADETATVACH